MPLIQMDGFCGPSYQYADVPQAAIERTVNQYSIANESKEENKTKFSLKMFPGNAPFSQLPPPNAGGFNFAQPCRGLCFFNDSCFGVNGNVFYILGSDGLYQGLGHLSGVAEGASSPVIFAATGQYQLCFTEGATNQTNLIGVYNLPGAGPHPGVFTEVNTFTSFAYLGNQYITFQDGYVLTILPSTKNFQISGTDDVPIGDFTLWEDTNISFQGGQADALVAIVSSREYIRLFGERRSQVYYNAGANGLGGFPFQSYSDTFIETGCAAPYSIQDLGDSLIWIGSDARGIRACWRDKGFQPQRVSTFAVESQWQAYATLVDAVAMSFIWNGHLFYQISFPTANHTWVYDATMSDLTSSAWWFERDYDGASKRPELYHAFAYGRNLVGSDGSDGNPGAVYQLADNGYDTGLLTNIPIIPQRVIPHYTSNGNRLQVDRIRVNLQDGYAANLNLAISRDGGKTYGNPYSASMLNNPVIFNRLGIARDFVFKFYGDGTFGVPYNYATAWMNITELAS